MTLCGKFVELQYEHYNTTISQVGELILLLLLLLIQYAVLRCVFLATLSFSYARIKSWPIAKLYHNLINVHVHQQCPVELHLRR